MNVKEGTRRLALVIGLIGASVGAVVSYVTLHDALRVRARQEAFERLATLDAVEQERKYLLSLRLSADAVPEHTDFDGVKSSTLDMSTYRQNSGPPPGTVIVPNPYAPYGGVIAEGVIAEQGGKKIDLSAGLVPPGFVPLVPEAVASAAHKEGVKSIVWNKKLEIQSIETEDGNLVVQTQQPSLWSYLVDAILPLLGFVIPWGALRIVVWVGYGFAQNQSSRTSH